MSDIYLSITETPAVVTLSQPVVSGALSSTVTVANTVTVALDANSLSALENVTVTVGAAVSISNFPASQVVSVSNFPASSSVTIGGFSTSSLPPSTVTVANTVTIAGTVTANVPALNIDTGYPGSAIFGVSGLDVNAVRTVLYSSSGNGFNSDDGRPVDIDNPLPISGTVIIGNSVTIGSLPAISGTVTANVADLISQGTDGDGGPYRKGVQLIGLNWDNDGSRPVQTDNVGQLRVVAGSDSQNFPISGTVTVGNSVTIGSLPAISGTVTANNPNGALTTRFGSVTTANTAQITSAVTNTSRKYLLAQNISAGTVTIGIGFSPTTTQGIQLTAGAGLTFDSFCPTGAVYWLGAVTGAAFTILEG